MRVLLVEDEPNAARVLAKGLREQTYAVDVAADGDSALFQMATAIAVIGGIPISMLLSLIITPAIQFFLTRSRA